MVARGEVLSGRYVVEDELGSGGMGSVYRAVDLRTGAAVAVKVPHPFLARDPIYIERLRREARIAASVRSPRVALVTDFGDHEGTPYLVMEFVPGETLSDQIERDGAMPAADALHVAHEVARALEEAHAGGIVHRDLKPQNIRRTHRGDVKVLDFGIARLEGQRGLTVAGSVIGSPEYLAPERAEGAGDIRSDIYSLGVVLYEMLTGRVPFDGGTPWTVLRRQASDPPPPMPPGLPAVVYPIVERCLAKRPEDRYQTPRELTVALQEALHAIGQHPGSREFTLPHVAPTVSTARAVTPPPAAPMPETPPSALAPTVAFGTAGPPPETGAAGTPVPPAETAAPVARRGIPAWAYAAMAAVLVVAAAGTVIAISRGGSSGPQASTGGTGAGATVSSAPSDGSQPVVAVAVPANGASVTSPVQLEVTVAGAPLKPPAAEDLAARHLHYFIDSDPAAVLGPGQPIPTGVQNIIHTASTNQRLDLPPGPHTVWVVITDNNHIPIASGDSPKVRFTVTGTGTPARSGEQAPLVYQSLIDGKWRLFVMDLKGGTSQRLSTGAWNDVEAAWSPDGSRIVFVSDRDGRFHLYTMNADGSGVQPFTSGESQERAPAWSPDGSRIAFSSNRDAGRDQVFVMPVAGGDARQVTRGGGSQPAWSPDGKQLAFVREQGGVTHIYAANADGSGEPKQLTSANQRHIDPSWSPDGKRIAFVAFRDNRWNVYVMGADGSDMRPVTREELDRNPAWSPDGKQIVFASGRAGQQQIFALSVEGGQPRRLTEGLAHSILPSWPRK
jgi:Tol biopolymer transport system component